MPTARTKRAQVPFCSFGQLRGLISSKAVWGQITRSLRRQVLFEWAILPEPGAVHFGGSRVLRPSETHIVPARCDRATLIAAPRPVHYACGMS